MKILHAGHAGLLTFTICLLALGQSLASGTIPATELKKLDEKPKAEAPKPFSVPIPANLIDAYSKAQKRTLEAKAALESSVAFKEYQLAFSQEQAALLYAMGEVGAKPSECVPILNKEGKLDHLECQPKTESKVKP